MGGGTPAADGVGIYDGGSDEGSIEPANKLHVFINRAATDGDDAHNATTAWTDVRRDAFEVKRRVVPKLHAAAREISSIHRHLNQNQRRNPGCGCSADYLRVTYEDGVDNIDSKATQQRCG